MNYTIIIEIIITLIYISFLLIGYTQITFFTILTLIVYWCLKLLYYIDINKKYSKLILFMCTFLLVISCNFNLLILLFLPICVAQIFFEEFNKYKFWTILSLIVLLLFKDRYTFYLYIILFAFTNVFIYINYNYSSTILDLKNTVYDLKTSKFDLKQKLELHGKNQSNIIYQSQLEERNKLSQKLHDELGHTLSGNILRLEAIKLVMENDPEKALALLSGVVENLRNGTDDIRAILRNAKPDISSINISTIKNLIEEVQAQSGIAIELNYNSDVNIIEANVWEIIVSNIKECLTNMMKYSKASKCVISFNKLNKLYKVTVTDNGIGVKQIVKGLGFKGMDERLASVGGNIIYDASNGFSVTMIFKID